MSKDFSLAVDEKNGFYGAVLFQKHGDKFKPLAYYSQRLSAIVRGLQPPCPRAVAAAAAAVAAASPMVAHKPLTVLFPHAVATIPLQAKNGSLHSHLYSSLLQHPESTTLSVYKGVTC